jgi:hypothetical protein
MFLECSSPNGTQAVTPDGIYRMFLRLQLAEELLQVII